MKWLKIALGVVLFFIVLFFVAGLFLPKTYRVTRAVSITAPPELVFEHLRQYRLFVLWSPWTSLDPSMKQDIAQDGRPGATYTWSGNATVGSGKMTMTAMEIMHYTEHELVFEKPFSSKNRVRFELQQQGKLVDVRWVMQGEAPYPWNTLLLFISPERQVGPDYERGLQNLKQRCEQMSQSDQIDNTSSVPLLSIEAATFPEVDVLMQRATLNFADISGFLQQHTAGMLSELQNAGAKTQSPLSVYFSYDEAKKTADMAAAIPYQGNGPSRSAYEKVHWPARTGWYIDYYGSYEGTYAAYDTMEKFLIRETASADPALLFEEYVVGPVQEKDPSRWHTRIWFFTKK